jgi:transcriptional regulator with XRE-family HTH domain
MTRRRERTFGQVIRERRRQLDLTQQEVGRRIKTSTPYVGHLESGKRHPSDKVLSRLAEVLALDRRELFFLANPGTVELLKTQDGSGKRSAWDEFRKDDRLRRTLSITSDEMDLLSRLASMGEIQSAREFVYVLNTLRHALGR